MMVCVGLMTLSPRRRRVVPIIMGPSPPSSGGRFPVFIDSFFFKAPSLQNELHGEVNDSRDSSTRSFL